MKNIITKKAYTLIEIMVSFAILVIVIIAGYPFYSTYINNVKIRTQGETFAQAINLTRAEALTNNARVTFLVNGDTSWAIIRNNGDGTQTTINSKSAAEGTNSKDGDLVSPTIQLTLNNGNVSSGLAATAQITFDGLGEISTNPDNSMPLQLIDLSMAGADKPLRVGITNGGVIRVCDPAVADNTDTRFCVV